MSHDVVIIDYGVGNLASVANMFRRIGANPIVTGSKDEIRIAKRVLLPGVGAFQAGMENLEKCDLIPVIKEVALEKKVPFLGICLGAQILGKYSEEGQREGLGLIDFDIPKFVSTENLKVPHMGWNYVKAIKETPLSSNMMPESRFYFVHSYYMKPRFESDILFTTTYGIEFASGVAKENIYGVQFHPEKSHKFGMDLLKKFVGMA